MNFKLEDEVIAHIAKLVQLAILTGTDVVDHMRLMTLTAEGEKLGLESTYSKTAEENIYRMLTEIEGLTEDV